MPVEAHAQLNEDIFQLLEHILNHSEFYAHYMLMLKI